MPEVESKSEEFQHDQGDYRAKNPLEGFVQVSDSLSVALKELLRPIANAIEELKPIGIGIALSMAAKEELEKAGILPHTTTPWSKFSQDDPSRFSSDTMEYYRENWDVVRAEMEKECSEYQVGVELHAAYKDALICHSHRLYRSSVLTLFPYIEGEFRKAYHLKPGGKGYASLREFRETLQNVPAGVALNNVAPFRMMKMLDEHFYEGVLSEEAVHQLSSDPIPNRHAALHGLIDYNSELNSLNTIIFASYFMSLVHSLKTYLKSYNESRSTP